MGDPRRYANITPRYVRNGRAIMERRYPGYYTHDGRDMNRWIVERIEAETADGQSNPSAGLWTYRREDRAPDDVFCTKADAIESMQVRIYGASSRERGYDL